MRKIHLVLALAVTLSTTTVFAEDSQSCMAIAQACSKAGFAPSMQFWTDCMKPVILGKTVKNVAIDAATAKACRADKINQLKKELDEFQKP